MASIGTTNKAFISAVELLDSREILKSVSDIQNDEGLVDILGLAGRSKVTKMGTYHNFVNEPIYVLGDTTGATVVGSGTPEVITTLTEATSGNAREGDLVKFPNSKVGIITDNSPVGTQDVLTIYSVDGTNLTHTANQLLSFFSGASGEKSNSPDNIRTDLTKYYNKLQIFRETNEITDVQNSSTVEVEFGGKNNIVFKDLIEKAVRLKGKVNGAFIGGKMSSTTWGDAAPAYTDPKGGGTVQTTRGLDDYIELYGVTNDVDVAGVVDIDDLEELLLEMIAAKAPKKFKCFSSSAVQAKIDKCLKGLNSSGATSGRMSLDGKEIDFSCTKFSWMHHELEFALLPILDQPQMFSQTDIVDSMYMIPDGNVKVVGGGSEPRIQTRYFKNQIKGGTEMIAEWHDGALAPTGPVGEEAIWKTYWATTQGLEVLGAEHFGKFQVL